MINKYQYNLLLNIRYILYFHLIDYCLSLSTGYYLTFLGKD